MDPPMPAVAVIVQHSCLNEAKIVALDCMLLKVDIGPCETLFTSTLAIAWPVFGKMLNAWLAPGASVTTPGGAILPPLPAVALMVQQVLSSLNVPSSQ